MKLVQACLSTKKYRESSFERCGGPVKLMQDCLSVRKGLEGSVHHSGGPVCLVQPVYVRERPDKAVLTSEGVL